MKEHQNINNQDTISENTNNDLNTNEKITYTQLGFHSARSSIANPDAIENCLAIAYDKYIEEQKLDDKQKEDRISRLNSEIQNEQEKKQNFFAELNNNDNKKLELENVIKELNFEKVDIQKGNGEIGEPIPFVIGSFITILLTLYLFVFYSSSGYSAFYGIKPGSLGFINPNVFADANNKEGGVIALIILFPVIFLGLGFLIHDSLEKNKILSQKKEPKQYSLIITLLVITLLADAFIGYKISEGVHTNDFNAGRTNDLWKFSFIFTDINFYLILILGFVVYVIWGFMLHYVLSNPYLKSEDAKIKIMLENINIQIAEKRNELTEVINKYNKLKSDIQNIDDKIALKQKDIRGYQTGVTPVNITALKACIGEFMQGWQNFTLGYFSQNKANNIITTSISKQTIWLNSKIDNLQNDNN